MKTIRYKGYSYSVIIRGWRIGDSKYEVIKRKIGCKADWTIVSINEYRAIIKQL